MRQRQSQVSRQARLSLEDWYDIGGTGTLPMEDADGGGTKPGSEEAASQMGADSDKPGNDQQQNLVRKVAEAGLKSAGATVGNSTINMTTQKG